MNGIIIPVCVITLPYALCLLSSIKKYCPGLEVGFLVKNEGTIPLKYQQQLDYIIEAPYGYDEKQPVDIIAYQAYYTTPFLKTLLLSPRSLVLSDISYIFENAASMTLFVKQSYQHFLLEGHGPAILFDKSQSNAEFFEVLGEYSKNYMEILGYQKITLGVSLGLLIGIVNQSFNFKTDDSLIITDVSSVEDEVECFIYDNSKIKMFNYRLYGLVTYNQLMTSDNLERFNESD